MLTVALIWGSVLIGFVAGAWWGHRHTEAAQQMARVSVIDAMRANIRCSTLGLQVAKLNQLLRDLSVDGPPQVDQLVKELIRVHEAWAVDQDEWKLRVERAKAR